MKRLWVELQRWNNSRAVVCDRCGSLGRRRTSIAHFQAHMHAEDHALPALVKVKRFG